MKISDDPCLFAFWHILETLKSSVKFLDFFFKIILPILRPEITKNVITKTITQCCTFFHKKIQIENQNFRLTLNPILKNYDNLKEIIIFCAKDGQYHNEAWAISCLYYLQEQILKLEWTWNIKIRSKNERATKVLAIGKYVIQSL